jgi:hypothetical protein
VAAGGQGIVPFVGSAGLVQAVGCPTEATDPTGAADARAAPPSHHLRGAGFLPEARLATGARFVPRTCVRRTDVPRTGMPRTDVPPTDPAPDPSRGSAAMALAARYVS